jgi:glutamate-1-semialdehyde aminotransferase
VLIAPYNDIERSTALIEKYHDSLGAVIVEPFQRTLSPLPGFLRGLRDVTAHYSIPLIYDEVVTGVRFAYGGAQEYYGVIPDLAAFGKIIGGGYPLAAVVGKAEIMEYFARTDRNDLVVNQVGTLNGNPIAATAGLATFGSCSVLGPTNVCTRLDNACETSWSPHYVNIMWRAKCLVKVHFIMCYLPLNRSKRIATAWKQMAKNFAFFIMNCLIKGS